ncbi:MAG: hypothetical protein ACYCXW_10900 [Solirubrobacteraceae bacterium]
MGSYVTDGRRLLHVVSMLAAGKQDVILELEDCVSYDVEIRLLTELATGQLRPVHRSHRIAANSHECSPDHAEETYAGMVARSA